MNFDAMKAFQETLTTKFIAGNDVAVYVDSEPVYRYMTGYRDLEAQLPITRDTLYRMFSMTKPITVTAAMQLYEKGLFLLEDPLSDYLPEFRDMKVERRLPTSEKVIEPARNPIRLQNLFEMTSGLDYDVHTAPLDKLYADTGCQHTNRQFAQAVAQHPLRFEPGSHWLYGFSHDVLACFVEVVSGMKFRDYVKQNIFDPLGMETATFHPDEDALSRLCVRYGPGPDGSFVRGGDLGSLMLSPNFESGGGGVVMSIDDYAKFACAITNRGVSKDGVRILGSGTVDLIRQNRLHGTVLEDFQNSSLQRMGYGYGLGVRVVDDRALAGNLSASQEFGWNGAWGTYVLMDPERRLTLVYGQQRINSLSGYVQKRLRNLAYAALDCD